MRILLITPGYYPAAGGAANYSHILANLLADYLNAEKVDVFTEYCPEAARWNETSAPRVTVHRDMPWRATRDKKDIWSLFLYTFQLMQMGGLLLKKASTYDAVLLHGSLLYRTGFLAWVIWLAKRLGKENRTRYFLDIRDPLMPSWVAPYARQFDGVVACSRNVTRDLVAKGIPQGKIREIPIPLPPHQKQGGRRSPVCRDFGLEEKGYVFVAHGFMAGKRTEEVIDAVRILREQGRALSLAVAGRARYWPENAKQAQKERWLYFLGQLPNDKVRSLMAESLIHVNVCTVEGLPRGSLEAIASGALTVLPPGVPEIEDCCRQWIGTAGNPRCLAEEIEAVLQRGIPAPYPVELHYPEAVAREYGELFSE